MSIGAKQLTSKDKDEQTKIQTGKCIKNQTKQISLRQTYSYLKFKYLFETEWVTNEQTSSYSSFAPKNINTSL